MNLREETEFLLNQLKNLIFNLDQQVIPFDKVVEIMRAEIINLFCVVKSTWNFLFIARL